MRKWRARWNTVHSRILLVNMVLVILIACVPQLLYIPYFTNTYNQEIRRQSAQNVNKLKYAVDETILDRVIRLTNIYFSDIPSNEVLTYPLTHDISANGSKIAEVSNFLTDIPYKLNFLQSVEVWYTAGNVYINDKYSSYLNSPGSRKSLDEDWIDTLKNLPTPNRWLPPREAPLTNATVITYLSNIPLIDSLANRQAVVAINIKESAVHNLIQASPADGEVLFVVDESGRVLVHSDRARVGQLLGDKDYIRELLQADSGAFEASVDGVQSVVAYAGSRYNQWKYVSVISIDALYQKSKQLRQFLIGTTLLLLVVSLLLSVYVTHRANKPLRGIIQTILKLGQSETQGDKGARSEWTRLHHAIDGVTSTITELNHQMEANKPILRDKYIMRLLQGAADQSEAETSRMEQMLDLRFNREKSLCLAIKITGAAERGLGGEMLAQYRLMQELEELERLEGVWRCSTLDPAGRIVLLLHYNGELDPWSLTLRIAQQMEGRCIIGAGQAYAHAYPNIARSYREACECLNYSFIMPGQSYIRYDELALASRKEYGSGLQLMEQLSAAIRSRSKEMVVSVLDMLRKALASGRYQIDFCRNTAFDAISVVRSAAIAMELDPERFLGYDVRDYGRKMEHIDELTEWLTGVALQLMEASQERGEDGGTALERQIMAYIEENIYNEISLTSLSEGIHMNASYVSRIYKSVMGSNFSEHLAGIKMKHAERLLRESDLSIKDIAGKLGYSSPRYFASLFKETYGCTPKSYRDQLGGRTPGV